MDFLLNILKNQEEYRAVETAIRQKKLPVALVGLSAIHKAHYIYALSRSVNAKALILVADEAEGVRLCEDLNRMTGEGAYFYPSRDFTFRSVEGASKEYEHLRVGILSKMVQDDYRFIIACSDAACQYTAPPEVVKNCTKTLKPGDSVDMDRLAENLVSAGYVRVPQVEGTGQFAVRGGILDVFIPGKEKPARIELWGDEIDSVSDFDVATQRREDMLDEIQIIPAVEVIFQDEEQLPKTLENYVQLLKNKRSEEARKLIEKDLERLKSGLRLSNIDKYIPLLYPSAATLFDYFKNGVVYYTEGNRIKERMRGTDRRTEEDLKILFEQGILAKGLEKYAEDYEDLIGRLEKQQVVYMDTFSRTQYETHVRQLHNVNARQLSVWGGSIELLSEDIRAALAKGWGVAVLAGTDRGAAAVYDDLHREGFTVIRGEAAQVMPGQVYVREGGVSAGFEYPSAKFSVFTHGATSQNKARRRKNKNAGEEIRNLSDIIQGDYVVHSAHGIGIFEGVEKLTLQGIEKDYLKIRYAGTDTLYVPVTQLDMVSKYIGPKDDVKVKVHKLGGTEWQKTRARVKSAVKDMAKELIALYAQRMKVKGYAFSEDNQWQTEFEERFEYNETDDQLRCAEEIKADMERPVPMDRLLCGDVGFGKTEVALRAAFKCMLDNKQCAILVPTTILAWQHYQTILKRMESFAVRAEILSRFRTSKQQDQIIRKIRRGEVDIVVGTHRVIQKDVVFANLGLVIVDEEQRFGVAQKEKLKETFSGVDVLTLSATPIPRTLNMAMSGIRDMSIIEEAPNDRHPIQTYVLEYDDGVIADAIRTEMRRGGQVYYLYNKIETMDRTVSKLAQMVPEARITFAHGKMSEEELSEVWRKLLDGEVDVLVCTTIIETGVDVANVNTLIIEDSDRMGLSQLHQIRGRVGRSSRRAFAYFTFRRGKALSEIATKRLSAIREYTEFGSGFRIAMRDLEIRGAGNILGAQQHGHMESVGYDMYLRLLSEAVAEEKGEQPQVKAECLVDVAISAHIPEKYVQDSRQRIDIYKRIASITNQEDCMDVIDELTDRFGDVPLSVMSLIDISLLRNTAALCGITEITQKGDNLLFYLTVPDMESISNLVQSMKGRVMVSAGTRPYISVRLLKGDSVLEIMKQTLSALSKKQVL